MSPDFRSGGKTRIIMAVDDDKSTSGDNIKVPKFDHSNKTVSRDSRIRAYTQSFKCAAMAKYGTAGGALFQPLAITKAGATPPSLHFAKKGKITKQDLLNLNLTKATDSVISSVIIEVPEAETNLTEGSQR